MENGVALSSMAVRLLDQQAEMIQLLLADLRGAHMAIAGLKAEIGELKKLRDPSIGGAVRKLRETPCHCEGDCGMNHGGRCGSVQKAIGLIGKDRRIPACKICLQAHEDPDWRHGRRASR